MRPHWASSFPNPGHGRFGDRHRNNSYYTEFVLLDNSSMPYGKSNNGEKPVLVAMSQDHSEIGYRSKNCFMRNIHF